MRWLLVVSLAISLPAFGQQQDEKKCPPRETYKSLRFDEDWSGLRDPRCRIDPLDDLKFIPIGEQAYVSLGGEARLRYERYVNPGFGSDPATDSGYLLQDRKSA